MDTQIHDNDKKNAPDPAATALLARLAAIPLADATAPLAFEARLADEQGWTLGHACKVVDEYRRFLVLTQLAGTEVCPPEDVDQAWHLHLTRTASYARMCTEALGGFLHHHPSRGGSDELARHRAMYEATKRAYRRLFGAPPPSAIWPGVDARFRPLPPAPPARVWPVPGDLVARHRLAGAALVGGLGFGVLAHALGLLDVLHALSGPTWLMVEAVVLGGLALALLPHWAERDLARAGAGLAGGASALDPYEVAWLAGGAPRMASTAITTLVDRGLATLTPQRDRAGTVTGAWLQRADTAAVPGEATGATALHPAEIAGLGALGGAPGAYEHVVAALQPFAEDCRRRLTRVGLAVDETVLPQTRALALLVGAGMLAVSFERLVNAVIVARPHGFLVLLLLVHGVLLGRLARRSARTTPRADTLLRSLRRRLPRKAPAPADARLPLAVALMGAAAVMAEPRFAGLPQAVAGDGLARRGGDSPGSSSGCSSGGDGGGGGGGCGGGGCGGCGG